MSTCKHPQLVEIEGHQLCSSRNTGSVYQECVVVEKDPSDLGPCIEKTKM